MKSCSKAANGGGGGWNNVCNNSPIRPARFFPLRQRQHRALTLHTELGPVRLQLDYGREPETGQWHSPQQRAWGLLPHQKITPGLAEKLCFTATMTGSYAQACAVIARWGVVVDDSVLHQQVQQAGERADQQAQARVAASAAPAPAAAPPLAGSLPPGALVIMMDGWMIRHRGADWGLQPAHVPGERVAWQECKSAVIYRLEATAQTAGGRGLSSAVEKEINYFEPHRAHLHYQARAAEGCPVGSGAMESLCAQLQGRFKRGGQFGTEPGRRRLLALEVARRNLDWDEVWQRN